MKDPFGLEPRGGDYVAYLESLQAGKIKNLEPLKIAADASGMPQSVAEDMRRRTEGAETTVRQAAQAIGSSPMPQETAEERMKRRAAEQNKAHGMKFLGLMCTFAGFGVFSVGGVFGQDEVVILGMLIAVVGFQFLARSTSQKKGNRSRQ